MGRREKTGIWKRKVRKKKNVIKTKKENKLRRKWRGRGKMLNHVKKNKVENNYDENEK